MKKLLMCFFAGLLFTPGANAATGAFSRVVPSDAQQTQQANSAAEKSGASATSRGAVRAVTDGAGATEKIQNSVRGTVSRVFTGNAGKGTSAENTKDDMVRATVISRAVNIKSGDDVARSNLQEAVNTVGRNKRVSNASINSNPTVRRAGLVLRPSTAEVGGRAIIGDTGVQTGSNIDEAVRNLQSRAATDSTRESIAQATERLEQTATLNKSCQEQYNECMDQFCAVIDANQGRCSCSANLAKYTKVEEAVKDANVQLNEVAQRIRYVGLSADEIRAIMTETEAEEALSGATDTSETRNMLEQIEDLIRDPSAGTSYAGDSYSGFDMDLDFSSDTADLFSLDFLNTDSTSSFSNLRGADLYNAAKRRCTTVLNQCKGAGATTSQITGNYDLAIDKDCIAYEQGLVKMNETLVSNVRSANRMLQKARLAVLQNKNQYDAKGCIAALENCMKDDMVCGEDYFKCVDPTKIYIDENGSVVLGQKISSITAFMKGYNNANINAGFLETAYGLTQAEVNDSNCSGETANDGRCVAKYLLTKIGTGQRVTDEGLCRAVLDKCQYYTYDSNGNYKQYNDVVVNYVQRAMVNIRAAQHKIISDYASKCMLDIASCYTQQISQVNAWSSSASVNSIYNVMRGACRNVALTCAYAVFDGEKVCVDPNNKDTIRFGDDCQDTYPSPDESSYINAISEMFYQSMLCPENSTYQVTAGNSDKNGTEEGMVNKRCKCNAGYEVWGSNCVVACDNDEKRDASSGICEKKEAQE